MPPVYTQGPVTPGGVAQYVPNEVFGIAINWFAPRTPMLARINKIGDGASVFQMVGHKYRPRQATVTAGGTITNTGTSLAVLDASFFMAGDVVLLSPGDYAEVTVDPDLTNNLLTLRRGVGGSTAAAVANNATITLVGNSRTGAEDMPKAIQSNLTMTTQYMQTIQHPYSVGGSVNTNDMFPLQPGVGTPLEQYKMDSMQNCMDDAELAACYGLGEAASATNGRAKMHGLLNLIQTNRKSGAAITNYTGYHASDFQRDLLTAPRKGGGQPDIVFVASNWMDAFTIWSIPLSRLDQGDNIFGRQIIAYECSFLGAVTIVESSLLPPFTAYSLTSQEVRWRVKRPLYDQPYGITGDVSKGHMLTELSIEVDNESHHAWIDGLTGFTA